MAKSYLQEAEEISKKGTNPKGFETESQDSVNKKKFDYRDVKGNTSFILSLLVALLFGLIVIILITGSIAVIIKWVGYLIKWVFAGA